MLVPAGNLGSEGDSVGIPAGWKVWKAGREFSVDDFPATGLLVRNMADMIFGVLTKVLDGREVSVGIQVTGGVHSGAVI